MEEKNSNFKKDANRSQKKRRFPKLALSKRTSSAIYMGIAVCMVVMLTVSLISTGSTVNDKLEELDDLSISIPDISISIPDIGQSQSPTTKPEQEKPAGTDNSGVDAEVIDPELDKPEEKLPVYVRPTVGNVLKGYYKDSLVFSQTMQDFRTHSGVDIGGDMGANVGAYTDGIISKITNDPFMGTTVEISHEAGVTSVYKNLKKELPQGIALGVSVKAGETIGQIGDTAIIEIADEPHVHFELWVNGECINAEQEIATLK